MAPTAKEEADALAIGGLRKTADSVSRLTYSAAFGRGLGVKLAVFFGACNLDLGEGRDNGRWWRSVVVMSDGGQRW